MNPYRARPVLASRRVSLLIALLLAGCGDGTAHHPQVVPNDNRVAGGTMRGDTLEFTLDAVVAGWKPDANVDSTMTVQAFAALDGVPRIPGPLLRVAQGTVVRVQVTNHVPDSVLVVHGLRPGSTGVDTVQVAPNGTRAVIFTAGTPGTYLYRGATLGDRMKRSELPDGLLAGAIVIDAAGVPPDTSERIFVITTLDILPDTTKPEPRTDLFDLALNGVSWPFTERLLHQVNDSIRWRLINATATPHPMHLHGFHFTALAKGDGQRDTLYAADARRMEVTELMEPGSTLQMSWTPTRAGNWLFHCHIIAHIIPFPFRDDSVRAHGMHDLDDHPATAMSGLILGIEVRDRTASASVASAPAAVDASGAPARALRLFAQQASAPVVDDSVFTRGYVLQRGASAPARDSLDPSPPVLVLTRGERTAITVINHLPEHTSVHWHGMELESYYDGVAGWSGTGTRRAPLIAPNDSFVAIMTPPREGTFMYHPHMDEEDQITAGLFGPLIVLEPGERFDAATDLPFMLGDRIVGGKRAATVNGQAEPPPLRLRVGQTYRLRFLSMFAASPTNIRLHVDSVPLTWTPRAKDGAELPASARALRDATLHIGVGETYDVLFTPGKPQRAVLEFGVVDASTPIRLVVDVR